MIFKIIIVILGCFLGYDIYTSVPPESRITSFYKGTHKLHKMVNSEIKNSQEINGFFIFGIGWINGNGSTSDESVTFAWLNNQSEYVITKLPLNKIRIKFENIDNPYVKFKWRTSGEIENSIIYAVIICKKSDWSPNINLPLGK